MSDDFQELEAIAARVKIDRRGELFMLPDGKQVRCIFKKDAAEVLEIDTHNPVGDFHVDDIKGYEVGTVVTRVFDNQRYTLAHEHKTGEDYTRRFQFETVDE